MSRLAELEELALAGETVSPAELAEAREAERIAALNETGAQKRAAAEAELRRADVVEAAKREVARLFDGGVTDALAPVYAAAVAALANLVGAVEQWNEKLDTAARTFDAAGVLPRPLAGRLPEDVDPRNHARIDHGWTVLGVTSNGVNHVPEEAALWVRAAVLETARTKGSLQIRYFPALERQIAGDIPRVLRETGRA